MRDPRPLRIGTRGSRLALWQAAHVATRLTSAWPRLRVETRTFETTGDRVADVPLPRIGDRGLFTRDIEDALREGAIDIAVHSLKDLPTAPSEGTVVGAVLDRADPREALVSRNGLTLAGLPRGARVGTSSLRRRAQLLALRPDLEILDVRGNVPTRVDKAARGDYDAVLLASAGLARLSLLDRAVELFDTATIVPAPGQGALAVQTRSGDSEMTAILGAIDDQQVRLATLSERTVLGKLQGGCQAPLGAFADWRSDGQLRIVAVVGAVHEARLVRADASRPVSSTADAIALGETVADELRARGAAEMLAAAREWVAAVSAGDRA
jgi:hydroxymethylbilane synthase